MPISFDAIPAALRTPGTYIEFNNELAGATGLMRKILVIGQRLGTGSVAAAVPTRVTNERQAVEFFGRGSMLALMLAASLTANSTTETWAVALDDNVAGVAATGTLTINSTATAAGTLNVYIGGKRVQIAVATADAVADIASALATKINAMPDLPVTATAAAAVVTLTARNKGEAANAIDIRTNYYQGEVYPTGLALTIVGMAGGTGNPDISTVIDALGDEWYSWFATPYTDLANMLLLETELNERWGPMRQIDGRAFTALAGTHATVGTYGDARNNPHVSVMGINTSPTPPYIWSAVITAVAAFNLDIDPARPLQTLVLPGILAPANEEVWTRAERNLHLFDGISSYTVDRDGTVRIERLISTYQTNSAGMDDASYLDICTPETLSRIRYAQRVMISQKFPRHKLADDGTNYGTGQAIATPKIVRGELLALYRELETQGWVEGYDEYDTNLIVERDANDRNRLNWRDTPNLVNQARVFAGKQQFIV